MPIVGPEILERIKQGTTIIHFKDPNGTVLGYQGRFLKSVFDNYTECLRENAKEREQQEFKKLGLNQHGQTKEQAKAFEDRKKVQQAKKEKAELALIGAAAEMRR